MYVEVFLEWQSKVFLAKVLRVQRLTTYRFYVTIAEQAY